MDDLKTIINMELSNLVVTEKLKTKTLKKIFKKENRLFSFFNIRLIRSLTLLTSFIVVLSISFDIFFKNHNITKQPEIFLSSENNKCDNIGNNRNIEIYKSVKEPLNNIECKPNNEGG